MGVLDQLFSRSRREIETHATELVDNETGRHFITLAAELLAALRLWAQRQYRSDQAVRELLKAVDPVTLREVAAELQGRHPRSRFHLTIPASPPTRGHSARAAYDAIAKQVSGGQLRHPPDGCGRGGCVGVVRRLAPGYAMSLSKDRRTELREYLRARLPYDGDGSIPLIARAGRVSSGRYSNQRGR